MPNSASYREFTPVLQFIFRHGITINQVSTDMWKIQTASTAVAGSIDGLDISRTYPSFDLAVQALMSVVSKQTSAAA